MTPLEIRIALLQQGTTQVDIAKALGVTKSAVGQVVAGRRRSPQIRRAIADSLGKTYLQVWGEEEPEGAAASPGVNLYSTGAA